VKTYPAVDINSDHNLLCAKLKLRLKKVAINNKQRKFHLEGLRSCQAAETLKQEISSGLANILSNELVNSGMDLGWSKIKNAIFQSGEKSRNIKRLKRKD